MHRVTIPWVPALAPPGRKGGALVFAYIERVGNGWERESSSVRAAPSPQPSPSNEGEGATALWLQRHFDVPARFFELRAHLRHPALGFFLSPRIIPHILRDLH